MNTVAFLTDDTCLARINEKIGVMKNVIQYCIIEYCGRIKQSSELKSKLERELNSLLEELKSLESAGEVDLAKFTDCLSKYFYYFYYFTPFGPLIEAAKRESLCEDDLQDIGQLLELCQELGKDSSNNQSQLNYLNNLHSQLLKYRETPLIHKEDKKEYVNCLSEFYMYLILLLSSREALPLCENDLQGIDKLLKLCGELRRDSRDNELQLNYLNNLHSQLSKYRKTPLIDKKEYVNCLSGFRMYLISLSDAKIYTGNYNLEQLIHGIDAYVTSDLNSFIVPATSLRRNKNLDIAISELEGKGVQKMNLFILFISLFMVICDFFQENELAAVKRPR